MSDARECLTHTWVGYSCTVCGISRAEFEMLKAAWNRPEETTTEKNNFSVRNRRRCESPNGFNHQLQSWSLSDWMTATLGELGEAANVAKKLNRFRDGVTHSGIQKETENELRQMLKDEIADTLIYLDLMAQSCGFDLEQIVEDKFRRTSEKIGYTEV